MSLHFSSAEPGAFPLPNIVPIFPLPTVVFFPETYLPLHIFEQRYREMVQEAAGHEQCIGMALLKDGWEDQYEEAPPIYSIGCVGRIISSHKLSDGGYNIVLQGLHRCTYQEQTVITNYRQARITPQIPQPFTSLTSEIRRHLEETAQEYLTSKKATQLCNIIGAGTLTDSVLVHFDVDAIDCDDFPAADVPHPHGLSFDDAMSALGVFIASRKLVALVITEFNVRRDTNGVLARRLVEAVANALEARDS